MANQNTDVTINRSPVPLNSTQVKNSFRELSPDFLQPRFKLEVLQFNIC